MADLRDLCAAGVLRALSHAHREQLAELQALVVRYREHMEAHGLKPPDDSGAEALRRFRAAFRAAGINDPEQYHEWREGSWAEPGWEAPSVRP